MASVNCAVTACGSEAGVSIQWRASMSVDAGMIDEDHKCLIALINAIDLVGPGPRMREDMDRILAQLSAYADLHFQREERLQVHSAFTYARAHHQRHRALLRDLNAMIGECKTTAGDDLPGYRARLSEFLFHWLRDHIVKADLLMKPFVLEMQRHAEKAVPLVEAMRGDPRQDLAAWQLPGEWQLAAKR